MPIFNRRQAGFIVFEDGGTDGSGTDAGDKIIFDGGNNGDTAEHFLKYQDDVSDETKPNFLIKKVLMEAVTIQKKMSLRQIPVG